MKKRFLLSVALLISLANMAQQLVSSGGETQSAAGLQLSWTLGEPVIETISSGSTILTQGFHQTKLSATPVTDLLIPDIELKVFPNPTQDYVIIQFNELLESMHFSLFDLTGKMLENKLVTDLETKINMDDYPSGTYILKLYTSQQQVIQNFRIIKN